MKTISVENKKVVIRIDGVSVRYDSAIIEKRIASLEKDLEEWRKYQRLLTPVAADLGVERCPVCDTVLLDGLCAGCNVFFAPSR